MSNFEQKLNDAIWVGKVLFDRNKATGSSANLSFMHEDKIYITASGTCFGNLTESSFSVVDLNGNHISGIKPSKELPLHMALYEKDSRIKSVLHTHSFYSTLWSCMEHDNVTDVIPNYTPYLRMKLGTVGLVPYAKPGSEELFSLFKERVNDSDGYLLQNHGPIVGDQDLISAFYVLEELEESARIAWELRNEKAVLINS
ncbi:class II aldolase/adducin family protein [Ornithinibacillus bavariensis]|uniref:class II aldolase/adducin family protein n=1 Tax=Ornithinibacillus bavariensis TaxID=545502 RepID=UPI000ED31840|nr:aldolase [Ornithinibacillus sp.]